ncbi:MAG: nucleoside triphosphate pyrophosphohydrolase family protein [Erysipelotrichaceae bacterium]
MEFNEYQELALFTANSTDEQRLVLNGVMGLCGESGECIDIVKKNIFQGHELDKEKLKDELSDVLWYLATCAAGIDVKLEDIAIHNVNKLKKRYPNGFEAKRSINRED